MPVQGDHRVTEGAVVVRVLQPAAAEAKRLGLVAGGVTTLANSARAIRHRIARKGVENSQRLGRHRWTIERTRTIAWLAGGRLHRRYERKAEHFVAFANIACALICYRRLAK